MGIFGRINNTRRVALAYAERGVNNVQVVARRWGDYGPPLSRAGRNGQIDALRGVNGIHRRRVDILSEGGKSDAVLHMRAELRAYGAKVRLLDIHQTTFDGEQLLHKGRPIEMPDAIVSRSVGGKGHVLEEFERRGVFVTNGSRPKFLSGKDSMVGVFERANIPTPLTKIVAGETELRAAVAEMGYPSVIKYTGGSGGRGVFKVDSPKELDAFVRDKLQGSDRRLVVQEFIAESSGLDWRIDFHRAVDGRAEITAVTQREAPVKGEFRANTAERGGNKATSLDPNAPEMEEIRLIGQRLLDETGADTLGVDILHSKRGPLVCEYNTTPDPTELNMRTSQRERHATRKIARFAVFGTRPSTG